ALPLAEPSQWCFGNLFSSAPGTTTGLVVLLRKSFSGAATYCYAGFLHPGISGRRRWHKNGFAFYIGSLQGATSPHSPKLLVGISLGVHMRWFSSARPQAIQMHI